MVLEAPTASAVSMSAQTVLVNRDNDSAVDHKNYEDKSSIQKNVQYSNSRITKPESNNTKESNELENIKEAAEIELEFLKSKFGNNRILAQEK
jgi:hypothetical protein